MTGLPLAPTQPESLTADIRCFLLRRPARATLIDTATDAEREDYASRIGQRTGVDVSDYSILNIHRVGIDSPARYVFEEVLRWNGESPCWPDHMATIEEIDGSAARLRVVFLGRTRIIHWLRRRLEPDFGTLFRMTAVQTQQVPISADFDNARYFMWKCSGGYPIGVFSIYVRSAIAERDEREQTQVFFAVGFDPHGRRFLGRIHPIRSTWEAIHNRVTANVLNRFKALCEAGFREIQAGTTESPIS